VSASGQVDARTNGLAAAAVCLAAILPYLSTIDDYFVRDDFGVVQLLAQKPLSYLPRWFYTSWMDRIWGFNPDEVRPFTALTYQLTALGGAASPVLHHALNILIHAANGLLVMGIARVVASMSLPGATFAGVAFVVMPVHTESVAWITGRVDSLPALFYLASFLLYAQWRERGSRAPHLYVGSVLIFFAALFTKQNTITMVATLAAYDMIVRRQPLLPAVAFVRPYVAFTLLTAGYLYLRYLLFGQVAREGSLNAQGLAEFGVLFHRHLTHVVTGDMDGSRAALWIVLAGVGLAWAALRRDKNGDAGPKRIGHLLAYFGPVWWMIGVAPVVVAGYSSPRHVYLAAVGWAIVLGLLFDGLRHTRIGKMRRKLVFAGAALVLALYAALLQRSVREWNTIASVSHQAVRDVRATALAAPEGTLLIVGAPVRSWEWALPFAVRPPFTRTDLTQRVFIISPRPLSCCRSQWFGETGELLRRWSEERKAGPVVALRWDPDTGALARATGTDTPQLPIVTRGLLDLDRPDDLDRNLIRMIEVLPEGVK
jgi:hypothetical protein